MQNRQLKFGILGAGSIGAYVGGRLIHAGVDTVLVGRQRLVQEVRKTGLRCTDHQGTDFLLESPRVQISEAAEALADRDVVLVTVKSAATAQAAEQLKAVLSPGRLVVSLQNGVRNAEVLRSILTDAHVIAGMVPFNVVWNSGAHFHRGSSGALVLERRGALSEDVASGLQDAGFAVESHSNLQGILWGKLVLNLNNALNALSGLPIREQLSDRKHRRVLAGAIQEALRILRQGGIRVSGAGGVRPELAPLVLSLPDFLFHRVASRIMEIDPLARSSMWQDLERHRPTEIDFLNGEVVRLAHELGMTAPVNLGLTELIKGVEILGRGSPGMSAVEIMARIGLS